MKKFLITLSALISILLLSACGETGNTEEIKLSVSVPSPSVDIDEIEGKNSERVSSLEEEEIDIEDYVAYVESIEGNVVTIQEEGNTKLEEGSLLLLGERILTLKNAKVTLVFDDDSIIRLGENSSFVVEINSEIETKTVLNKGSLWGRILRPVGSESDFKIVANDVSATVRGTSVFITADEKTKITEINVIDSFSDKGVLVEKGEENIVLQPEETVLADTQKVLEKKKLRIEEMFKTNSFVRENTKEDIVYMKRLVEKKLAEPIKDEKTLEKIRIEIEKTIPKKEEIQSFFENEELSNSFDQNGEGVDIQENIVALILKDKVITSIKKDGKEETKQQDIQEVIGEEIKAESTEEVIKKIVKTTQKIEFKQPVKIIEELEETVIDFSQAKREEEKRIQERKEKDAENERILAKQQTEMLEEQQKEIQKDKNEAIKAQQKKEEEDIYKREIEQREQELAKVAEKVAAEKKKKEDEAIAEQKILDDTEAENKRIEDEKIAEKKEEIETARLLDEENKKIEEALEKEKEEEIELKKEEEEKSIFRERKKALLEEIGKLKKQKNKRNIELLNNSIRLTKTEQGEEIVLNKGFVTGQENFISDARSDISQLYNVVRLDEAVVEATLKNILGLEKQKDLYIKYYTELEKTISIHYDEILTEIDRVLSIEIEEQPVEEDVNTEEDKETEDIQEEQPVEEDVETGDTQEEQQQVEEDVNTEEDTETEDIQEEQAVEEDVNTEEDTETEDTVDEEEDIQEEQPVSYDIGLNLHADNGEVRLTWNRFTNEDNFVKYKVWIHTESIYGRIEDIYEPIFDIDINHFTNEYIKGDNDYKVCLYLDDQDSICSEYIRYSTEVGDSTTGSDDADIFTASDFDLELEKRDNKVRLTWEKFPNASIFDYYMISRISEGSDGQGVFGSSERDDRMLEKYDSTSARVGKNTYQICAITIDQREHCSEEKVVYVEAGEAGTERLVEHNFQFKTYKREYNGKYYVKGYWAVFPHSDIFSHYVMSRQSNNSEKITKTVQYRKSIWEKDWNPKYGTNNYQICAITYAGNEYCSEKSTEIIVNRTGSSH